MKKKFDIKIRFWSEADSAGKGYHLKTSLMHHATGLLLVEKLSSFLENNEIPLL